MSKFVQSKDVAWNYLGEKIIAFNLNGEKQFHDLNESAAVIFKTLQAPSSRTDLIQILLAEFEVSEQEAGTDIDDILIEFKNKKLITEA